ncbi:GntR family transcriptional regulator [Sedimentitalea sp. XS_ASV28]|uniref:GntR family transcriptional regulator n=1 Tax=Sedimentitalea sp. XS_ASV28 TaxID=3241296 RepID=UPI003511F039
MQIESLANSRLDPVTPIVPQISRILRERIIRADLKPGDRLTESEVARSYGVSRQPVRESFIRLADQGLVKVLPQRGTLVSCISYVSVLDSRFLREAIEADIVKILAQSPDPAVVADLRAQLQEQEEIGSSQPGTFIQLDDQFHRTLAEAAGKAGAWKQIEGLKSQMDRVRFLSLGEFPAKNLIGQHREIVDQIERGDIAGGNSAIRHHLREVLSDLPQIVAANTSFFELPDGDVPSPVNAPIQGGVNG